MPRISGYLRGRRPADVLTWRTIFVEVKGRITETYSIWEYLGNLNCDASINEWSSVWFWNWFQSRFAYKINVKSTSDPLSYKCYHFFSRVVPLAPLSAGMVPKLRIIPLDRCIKSHVKLTELEWPKTIKNKQKHAKTFYTRETSRTHDMLDNWNENALHEFTKCHKIYIQLSHILRRCLVNCSSNTHGECKNQTAALYVSYVSGNGYKWLWMPVCPRSFEACLIFMQFVTFSDCIQCNESYLKQGNTKKTLCRSLHWTYAPRMVRPPLHIFVVRFCNQWMAVVSLAECDAAWSSEISSDAFVSAEAEWPGHSLHKGYEMLWISRKTITRMTKGRQITHAKTEAPDIVRSEPTRIFDWLCHILDPWGFFHLSNLFYKVWSCTLVRQSLVLGVWKRTWASGMVSSVVDQPLEEWHVQMKLLGQAINLKNEHTWCPNA